MSSLTKVDNLSGEEWIKLEFGIESKSKIYYISNMARIKAYHKRLKTEKVLKSTITGRGYPKVSVKIQDKYISIYLHKAVAQNFVHQASKEHDFIGHKDYNRSNNNATNLQWMTKDEQRAYLRKRGEIYGYKKTRGGGNFKLTAAQVSLIKKSLISGKTRRKMIAKRFGVSSTQIRRIEIGDNWAAVQAAE